MKRVGLVTCFINNYGACLQAYALQNVIGQYVDDVEIIQYLEPLGYDNDNSVMHKMLINSITKKIASFISPKYKASRMFRLACEDFKNNYLKFGEEKYFSTEAIYDNPPDCDIFVCGSDQIWNPTFYEGPNKVYYLDFAGDKRKVAYAPSIGVSDIEEKYHKDFAELVNKVDFLSVREKTGSEIIRKYCNKDAKVVLDPTLLITGSEWRDKSEESNITISENYIFCYLFGDRPFYYEFIKYVKEKMQLPVYIIPFTDNQAKAGFMNIYDAGPLGFVKLIKNATFIITDSFHATAFSINMNKPFYTLLRDEKENPKGMNSRIYDVLSLVGLENRLWEDNNDFSLFSDKIIWDDCNKWLCQKRNEDKMYLSNAICD